MGYTTRWAADALPRMYGHPGWSRLVDEVVSQYWATRHRLRFVRDWAAHHDGGG